MRSTTCSPEKRRRLCRSRISCATASRAWLLKGQARLTVLDRTTQARTTPRLPNEHRGKAPQPPTSGDTSGNQKAFVGCVKPGDTNVPPVIAPPPGANAPQRKRNGPPYRSRHVLSVRQRRSIARMMVVRFSRSARHTLLCKSQARLTVPDCTTQVRTTPRLPNEHRGKGSQPLMPGDTSGNVHGRASAKSASRTTTHCVAPTHGRTE